MAIIEVGIQPALEGKIQLHHTNGNTHIISFLSDNYSFTELRKSREWLEKMAAICELGPDYFDKNYEEKE